MRFLVIRLVATVLFVLMLAPQVLGSNEFPLEPPKTSSPRATLESFLTWSEVFHNAMSAPIEDPAEVQDALDRAVRCFDLSEIPPTLVSNVGVESVLRLREIFDRIQLPELEDVPDEKAVKAQSILRWRMPHTEITIGKADENARLGSFLFTPETVDNLDDYYEEVRHLPYKDGAIQGVYEEYLYSSGWLIPDGFISGLPDWMRHGYQGQAIWQWFGLILTLALGFLSLCPLFIRHKNWKKRENDGTWGVSRLVFPLFAMGLCLFMEYFLGTQINITGKVLTVVTLGLEALLFLFTAWTILVGGSVAMHVVISSQNIKEEALDADVIKLVSRLVSIVLIFFVFYRAGRYFGLPVTAVFASASIAGVAVAFAARETLANFFGGISIFLDRPFRAGDYIVLDTGERGEVKAVGMRSTRLQTRDDILITIPNSVITNVKIVNQSAPEHNFRIRIKVNVAYGSDLEQVEEVLMEIAQANQMVMKTPTPRVRLRTFGDYSINFELLVWAIKPHHQGRLTHALSKGIYNKFIEEKIKIPFPQQDIHICSGEAKTTKEAPKE